MQFFLKKEVQSFVNSNGRKKTAFYIGEGPGDKIYEIRGITANNNNDSFNIQATMKTKNGDGRTITQHKVFRLKKSGINNLLSHSKLKLVNKESKEKGMKMVKKSVEKPNKKKMMEKPKKKVVKKAKDEVKPKKKVEKPKKKEEKKPKKKSIEKKSVKK